jgi:uncharacterized membrane protein YfcA
MLSGLAVGAGAAVQRVTGLGFSLVCAPALVAAEGALPGVRIVNALALLGNLVLLARLRTDVRWRDGVRVLVPAAVLALPAGLVARRLDPSLLTLLAGATALVAVAAVASGHRFRLGATAAGALAGIGNVVAGVGGPAVAAYALGAGWPPRQARASLQAIFAALNVVSIVALGPPSVSAARAAALAAALAGGLLLGDVLGRFASESTVRRGMIVVAVTGSVAAIGRGVAGIA